MAVPPNNAHVWRPRDVLLRRLGPKCMTCPYSSKWPAFFLWGKWRTCSTEDQENQENTRRTMSTLARKKEVMCHRDILVLLASPSATVEGRSEPVPGVYCTHRIGAGAGMESKILRMSVGIADAFLRKWHTLLPQALRLRGREANTQQSGGASAPVGGRPLGL